MEKIHQDVDPSLLWAHPSIEQLAHYFEPGQNKIPESKPKEQKVHLDEPIAVIGMSCRFPGQSVTLEKFWNLLITGRDGIEEIPANHFNVHDFYTGSEVTNKINSPFAGCLDDIDCFDAEFFKITPTEAAMMDPQQRLALEATWEAFEHACISPSTLKMFRYYTQSESNHWF